LKSQNNCQLLGLETKKSTGLLPLLKENVSTEESTGTVDQSVEKV
jgi:hypothetical protein